MRHLFYVPIIHTQTDLGSLGQVVKCRATESQASEESWADKQRAIEATWARIRAELLALPISWSMTRIYQDGLPICDRELSIVKDVAAMGSHNHRLILELLERGATLMGTEAPELLVRDYQRLLRLVKLGSAPLASNVFEQIKREGEELLRSRDMFIASRIHSTLKAGENGILLIGMLHRVDTLLNGPGICVHHLHTHFASGTESPQKFEVNES